MFIYGPAALLIYGGGIVTDEFVNAQDSFHQKGYNIKHSYERLKIRDQTLESHHFGS